jgi:alanine dehydrogenase
LSHWQKKARLYPQEALLEVKHPENLFLLVFPKEVMMQEKRVPLTPNSIKLLTDNGHDVWIESGAGNPSKFTDKEYSDAGAKIVYSHKEAI